MVSDLVKNIRLKLLLLILLPVLGLLYFASLSIYDKYRSYQTVQDLEQDVNYITRTSHLIEDLQKERGMSILYLSADKNGNFRTLLQKQRKKTEKCFRNFSALLLKGTHWENERTIKTFLENYKRIDEYRKKIDRRQLPILGTLDYYSLLIDDLIHSVKRLQPRFGELQLHRKSVDLLHILKLSEIAGKERALIARLLSAPNDKSNTVHNDLITLEHLYHLELKAFTEEADLPDLQLFHRYVNDELERSLDSFRYQIIFAHNYRILTPEKWWRLSTRYINALFQVEGAILHQIDRLKAQRKASAFKAFIAGVLLWILLLLLLAWLYRRILQILENFGQLYERSEAQKRLYRVLSELTEYHNTIESDDTLVKTLATLLYRTDLFPYLWISRKNDGEGILTPYISEGIPLALLHQEFSKKNAQITLFLQTLEEACTDTSAKTVVPTPEQQRVSSLFKDVGSLGIFPIIFKEKCTGILVLALPPYKNFPRESIKLLQNIASALGKMLENNAEKLEYLRIEEDLRISSTAFDTQEAIMISDDQGRILKINDAFTRITGYSPEEVLGRNPNILKSGKHERDFYNQMWDYIRKNGYWKGEIYNRRKNGEIYPEMLSISAVKDKDDNITHYVAHFFDITELKEAQKSAEYRAQHDPLTELYNRQKLMEELHRIYHMARTSGELNAFLFFDLDNFKYINDYYTHEVGDKVLMEIARRLKTVIRRDDILARIAGDEFAMILCCLGRDRHAVVNKVTIVAEKIKSLFTEPILIDDIPIETTFSIGIKLFPDAEKEWKEVIINADVAMYHAKRNGKDNYQFFNTEIDRESKQFLQIKNDFAVALKRHELVLHYQPRVQISSEKIVGMEALVRWRGADGTFRMPDDFLRVTQGNTLGYELSEYVLEEVTRQIEEWRMRYPAFDLQISINLSGEQFNSPTLMQQLFKKIGSLKTETRQLLEFEIVEDVFIRDLDYTVKIIEEFRELGIRFSIDDFGTGYSSINYLRHLPVETLKIDREFISDLFEKDNNQIVRLILETAKVFGMRTVAEGVESQEILSQLKRLGCDYYQGYLFSAPVPPETIEERWLASVDDTANPNDSIVSSE